MNAPQMPYREQPTPRQIQGRGSVTVVSGRRSRRGSDRSFFSSIQNIRRDSVRTQLITWNVIMLSVLFVVPCIAIRFLVSSQLYASVDQELRTRLNSPPNHPPDPPRPDRQDPNLPPPDARNPPPQAGGDPMHEITQEFNQQFDPRARAMTNSERLRPQRYDADANALYPINHPALWDPKGFSSVLGGEHEAFNSVKSDSEWYRVLTVRGRDPKVAVVQAAYSLTDTLDALAMIDRVLWMLVPVCLLCAVFGGAFLTDRVLRPLRQMTRSAEHIGAQNFDERLPVIGDDEFAELADTFNNLLARQEIAYTQQKRALEQMRRFTADASHELKTPLTVIQGNAGMALSSPPDADTYRQTLQEIDTAARGMSHLVHDLLLLARSDSGQLGRNVIELLVGELLGLAKSRVPAGAHARITLRLESQELSVIGNEMELVRLFSNLIDNAIHYTPETGRVTVTARCRGERGEWVEVKVADNGIGIAADHLAHLGERFYRADTSRARPTGGSGLGLSICKGIVEAHGGTISFASAPGVGTTVTVFLPHRPS